jgi:type II secretion system protein C
MLHIDMAEYERLLKKLRAVPWRLVWVLAGVSFVLASLSSFTASYILMPSFQQNAEEASRIVDANAIGNLAASASLSEADLKVIYERNIFNSEGELGDVDPASAEEQDQQNSKAAKTELPVKLLGVIYGGTPFNGLATIMNTEKGNKINSFIVGDMLVKDAKIIEIHRTKVFIDRAGRKEFLELDKAEIVRTARKKKTATEVTSLGGNAPIATGPVSKSFKEPGFEREGAKMVMSDTFKQRLLNQDFTKVLQDAKATPNQVDGQIKGFKLTRIRENSIYQKAGLQNNDVVTEINGVPLNNAASAIRLLQGLKNESEIEVIVQRDGSTIPLTLTIQ